MDMPAVVCVAPVYSTGTTVTGTRWAAPVPPGAKARPDSVSDSMSQA